MDWSLVICSKFYMCCSCILVLDINVTNILLMHVTCKQHSINQSIPFFVVVSYLFTIIWHFFSETDRNLHGYVRYNSVDVDNMTGLYKPIWPTLKRLHTGVIYSQLFKYTQQRYRTAGFTGGGELSAATPKAGHDRQKF